MKIFAIYTLQDTLFKRLAMLQENDSWKIAMKMYHCIWIFPKDSDVNRFTCEVNQFTCLQRSKKLRKYTK